MAIDISELVEFATNGVGIIFPNSIKVENNELVFAYSYLSHLPNPFDSYYDHHSQELHIIIQQDAFPFGSVPLTYKVLLPQDTKRVRVNYRGKSLDHLTPEERIEHFFPKLRAKDKEIEY